MARAFPNSEPHDFAEEPQNGDWQALRGELVALLDQVEGQYARGVAPEPGLDALANRMHDLRTQASETGPDNRHREALRSVKRQVDRFNERDEAAILAEGSRDVLRSAIQEIRARQGAALIEPARTAPHIDVLSQALNGVNNRIEQIEGELRQQRGTAANVKDIADQVSQITHVVELLAGAVGETGQVKRLEGQIAGLAQLVSQGQKLDLSHLAQRLDDVSETIERLSAAVNEGAQINPLKSQIAGLAEAVARGPQVDLSYLTRRLDEVSATVERLADLQIQQVQQLVRDSKEAPKREKTLKEGMGAIEAGVRNIYDRIDSIERTVALPPADVEGLTQVMAKFAAAMESNSGKPDTLIPLVEALTARIENIEGKDGAIAGLKSDVAELRSTVIETFEPRFAAIESRIDALGHRLAVEHPSDTGVAQLEAQVRQLVARMDQTGEQLTGLARLYSQPEERPEATDFEELANRVAARTSEALARNAVPPAPAFSDDQLASLEDRIARLFSAAEGKAPEDYTVVRDGIRRVDERLARLEMSLTQGDQPASAKAEAKPADPDLTAQVAPADDLSAVWAKTLAASEAQVSAPVGKNDKMPKNPGDDAPLTDRPFPDLGPVRAALEERAGSRKQHPGMAHEAAELAPYSEASTAAAEILGAAALRKSNEPPQPAASPVFDPASLDLPSRPQSAFDAAAPVPAPRPDEDFSPAPTATRNTFIEAARRNAQRQTVAKKDANPHSLIGRAMARFQTAQEAKAAPAPFAEAPPMTLAEKAGKKAKAKPAKQAAEMPVAVEDDTTIVPLEQDSINVDARPVDIDLPPRESFLTRHRRPILLGATLVAVSVLTLNLVNQRLAEAEAGQKNSGTATAAVPANPAALPTPEPKSAVGPTSLTTSPDQPAAKVGALPAAPRLIPMVDSLTTGSIDPSAAMNFSKPAEISMMPSILSPTSLTAQDLTGPTAAKPEPAPPAIASPVHVDLPPVNVGPLALRQAAANGDPRAQFEVAAIFTEGRAVPEDLKQAAVWYERAAAQGFAPAQYRLGNLYESGKGVEKDLQQARLWYQRAAEAGNRMSMHNLAALYAGGQLGKQDFPPAAEWFEQAAMRGMTDSQFNLGMLYARGLGVTQNLATSYKWFSLAARSGDKDAAKARDDVARSLDAAAVSKVNEELAAWKPVSIALVANFAPIGTWQKDFDPGQPITEKAVVSKVQEALQRLGYDVGTADGVAGVKTIDAIRSFEQATGMSQIGKINPRLLAVLGSQPV